MFNECIELRNEMHRRLVKVGVDTRPSWNEEWLDRVNFMPEGLEKEAKKDEAIQMILKSVKDIEARMGCKEVEKIGDSNV